MKPLRVMFLFVCSFVLIAGTALAKTATEILATYPLAAPPLAFATSSTGKWLFVITKPGQLQIYARDGALMDTVAIDAGVDRISPGVDDNVVLLGGRSLKEIKALHIDLLMPIASANAPFKGPANAPVVVAVFSEFQCVYCFKLTEVLDQVLEVFPNEVKLVFKHFPLKDHQFALKAALAAEVARRHGKFWQMHDRLFPNYDKLNDEAIDAAIREVGFEPAPFRKEMQRPEVLDHVGIDVRNGIDAGVRGTPALFINNRPVNDRSLDGLVAAIKNELERIGKK